MSETQFQTLTKMIADLGGEVASLRDELRDEISSLRTEFKEDIATMSQTILKTIGEHIEVFEADYQRTKADHELRLLRLEQS